MLQIFTQAYIQELYFVDFVILFLHVFGYLPCLLDNSWMPWSYISAKRWIMAASQLFQNMRESARLLLLANKSNVSACMNAIQPYSKFKPFQQISTLAWIVSSFTNSNSSIASTLALTGYHKPQTLIKSKQCLNLLVGTGFVNISAAFSEVSIFSRIISPVAVNSLILWNLTSICFVLAW